MLAKLQGLRREKINKVEKTKEKMTPAEALARLYKASKEGYDFLDKEDKAVFLKYFGLFDKDSLTPKQFMLRIRIPGGRLIPKQAEVLGEVTKAYAKDEMNLTTRMQVEIRNLMIEDVPTVFEKLESVGITSYQTGMDNLRNIVIDPLDGLSYDNVIESFPILEKLQAIFLKKDAYTGVLPRKFNTAISGSIANRCNVYGHDCCFILAMKEGMYGFNVYVGGKVGKVAKDANIFLLSHEVEAFFEQIVAFYKMYGFRDNRNKNRMHFLIEALGMEGFREAFSEFTKTSYKEAGETLCKMDYFENEQGSVQLKDGTSAVHAIVKAGLFSGSDMIETAKLAAQTGGEIRLSVEQNLFITHVSDKEAFVKEMFFEKHPNISSPFFNNLVACVGKNECSYGVIANKADALNMANFLETEFPGFTQKIRMHWSGCVKGCGIHEWGDIGFVGAKTKVDGKVEEAVDILLGGSFAKSKEAVTIFKAAPLRFAPFYIKALVEEGKSWQKFDLFLDEILPSYSKGAIAFMMKFNYWIKEKGIDYRFSLIRHKSIGKFEPLEIFDFGNTIYRELTSDKAYLEIHNFQPIGQKKPLPPVKLNNTLDEEVSDLVYKMVHPSPESRYKVFTEILGDMKLS